MFAPKKIILATACLACFSATPGFADWEDDTDDQPVKNYKEGNWGMGGGALAGAVIGGPPGFIIGAFAGKLVGTHVGMEKNLEEQSRHIEILQAELKGRDNVIASLKKHNRPENRMVASLAGTSLEMPVDTGRILQEGFSFTVNFKTNSDQIENHLVDQCRSLAKVLKQLPDTVMDLAGYSDTRGSEVYNLSLSGRRIAVVKNLLLQEGILEKNITTSVRGEVGVLRLGNDQDSYAFDRRVIITFSKKGGRP